MPRLDYQPRRPPHERSIWRTLTYAALSGTLIGLTFIMWAVLPTPGCELVCYSAVMFLLAGGSAFAAWWSYQED